MDPVLVAGMAHLWFVSIHPFEDGNVRIAQAIARRTSRSASALGGAWARESAAARNHATKSLRGIGGQPFRPEARHRRNGCRGTTE